MDVANQAISGQLPLPADGVPHLISPENLAPGTTMDPNALPNESANVSYLRQIWDAVQSQQITGRDALLAVATQRSLTGTAPDAAAGRGHGAPPAPPGARVPHRCRPRKSFDAEAALPRGVRLRCFSGPCF